MTFFVQQLRTTVSMLLISSLMLGLAYPAFCTLMLMHMAPNQSEGSLIRVNGKILGSELIGQQFNSPQYFWSRLSATSPTPYNAASSSGSNLSVNNTTLLANSKARIDALAAKQNIPADLATASGSGLDPHISPEAAQYQIARVAAARGVSTEKLRILIASYTEDRQFGFLGEPRVNVLKLNLALDGKL